MMPKPNYTPFRLRRFLRGEDGSATIEACIWIPFFFTFFLLVLDAAFIFMRQADAQRIVQDGTRKFITGADGVTTEDDLEDWLETTMLAVSPNADATINLSSGILTALVEYPAEDTDLTGVTGWLGGATMRVTSVQLTEQ